MGCVSPQICAEYSLICALSEYTWSRKAEDARETELKWRVKASVVNTFMFFIWYFQPLPNGALVIADDNLQDMAAFGNCPDYFPVLHTHSAKATYSSESFYIHLPFLRTPRPPSVISPPNHGYAAR